MKIIWPDIANRHLDSVAEYVEENFGSMTVAKTLDKIDKKVNYRCHRSSKAISKSSGYYFEAIFEAL